MSILSSWNDLKNNQEEEERAKIREKLKGKLTCKERKRLQDILDYAPPEKKRKKES